MEKIYHSNSIQKVTGRVVLILNKIYFKTKIITRDKEGHFLVIKESIHQKYIAIINLYVYNNREARYMN